MRQDLKDLGINVVWRFAEALRITDYLSYNYERRGELLEKIKSVDEQTFTLLNEFLNTQEKVDILRNDKDFRFSKPVQWHGALEEAQAEKREAGEKLKEYAQKTNVSLVGLFN